MKKLIFIFTICGLALLSSGCNAQNDKPATTSVATAVRQETRPVLLTQTDFTEVASRTIDAVVHIKTEMTRLTPLYQTFFGMIIDRGVKRQTYNAFGSGVIISEDG